MTAYIRNAAAEAAAVAPTSVRVSLRPALTYQSNRLYDAYAGYRHLIVKEFLKPEEYDEAPVREFKGLRLVARLGVAPQPLLRRPHSPHSRPLVVYDFMRGEMWDRRRPSPVELKQLASLWLTINNVTAEKLWMSRGSETPLTVKMERFGEMFGQYAARARAVFPAGLHAAEMCLSLLEQRAPEIGELAERSAPLCFCRADARFANVIARPDGRLGLVDWEDCGLRDPTQDLADIITAPNQEDLLDWDEWQPFLQPYLAGRTLQDPGLARRMHLYLALYPLAWLGWLLSAGVTRARAGELERWMIHEMAPNEKLRRYLARATAWPDPDFGNELEALADVVFFPEA